MSPFLCFEPGAYMTHSLLRKVFDEGDVITTNYANINTAGVWSWVWKDSRVLLRACGGALFFFVCRIFFGPFRTGETTCATPLSPYAKKN